MSGIIAQNSGRHTGLVKASSGGGGVWNLIKTYTASSSSDISFVEGTDGVDFTAYNQFVFKFIDIHPQTDAVHLQINFSTDTGSSYNVAKTTTNFQSFHTESDSESGVGYQGSLDGAQTTGGVAISNSLSNDNDGSTSGCLYLFAPSSTTFVKNYYATFNATQYQDYSTNYFIGGYGNTTSAVDAVKFVMSSGNIDSGQISLYGIS
jgi:hypothetical protein